MGLLTQMAVRALGGISVAWAGAGQVFLGRNGSPLEDTRPSCEG